MARDEKNVIAVHCKAGKGRTGMIIATIFVHNAYGKYSGAMDALKLFGSIRTKNGQGVTIPSQRRYVRYYEYSLKYGFPIENRKVSLQAIYLQGIPHFDSDGGCDPYVMVVNMKGDELYDSRVGI